MTIEGVIKRRGIVEVLHFTTNRGLTGILDSGVVKPRSKLSKDKRLEYIVKLNCPDRSRDIPWHGYVNLSITRINRELLRISRDKWHFGKVGWWCILSFSEEILCHHDVVFCTTNNAYCGVVVRGTGVLDLEKLFADEVVEYESRTIARRRGSAPLNETTCKQAEVLYPGELSLDYLKYIYVNSAENAAAVESLFCVYSGIKVVECIEKPELF